MRAMIVHGSPLGSSSGTFRLGARFAQGLRLSGWEAEEVVLRDLHLEHCLGCKSCWTRTPGVCVQQDDMAGIHGKHRGLDLLVLAAPLYYWSVPGKVKDFLDRRLPLYVADYCRMAGLEVPDGCIEPASIKFFLICTCGFRQKTNFDPLKATMEKIFGPACSGEFLVPFASMMAQDVKETIFRDVYELCERAGTEFGKAGKLSAETLAAYERLTTLDEERVAELTRRIGKARQAAAGESA
jgi:hypothetical protein